MENENNTNNVQMTVGTTNASMNPTSTTMNGTTSRTNSPTTITIDSMTTLTPPDDKKTKKKQLKFIRDALCVPFNIKRDFSI